MRRMRHWVPLAHMKRDADNRAGFFRGSRALSATWAIGLWIAAGGLGWAAESSARVDRLRGLVSTGAESSTEYVDYRVAATSRTGTMERELNHYAREGFYLTSVMGGETEIGGNELVAILERAPGVDVSGYDYLVLATSRTSTMDREMRDAARRGFVFAGLTVYNSAFGGDEVVVVMERNIDFQDAVCDYSLLATNRTSTMEDELVHYADKGFRVIDMAVASTAFGGQEVVVITERCVSDEE